MKALALVEAPDHVCGRYRVRAFAPALASAGWSLTCEPIAAAPLARIRQLRAASRFDCVILQRKLLPSWQMLLLRRAAKRLIFDFDDAVPYRDSYDPRGPHCRRRRRRFARTVRSADLVLAGNAFLASLAVEQRAEARSVRVIPTCIETDRYNLARKHPHHGPVRLAWIGSSSTIRGLEQRRSLLERIGREVPSVTLRLICDRFPDFGPLPVEPFIWSEASEADALMGGDIGVSWLPDDLWTRGKCGLKTLQSFAAGLPVVADPVGVQAEMIRPGVEGFLPEDDDAWVEAIRTLATEPDRRERMGQAARQRVERDYSVAAWSARFVAAVEGREDIPTPHSAAVRSTAGAVPR